MKLENVTQIIPTIQGEGYNVGQPTLLIRYSKCNLHCPFCDTKWSRKHTSDKFSVNDILHFLTLYPIESLTFTGGEPLLYFNEILNIIRLVPLSVNRFEMETNGTLIATDNIKVHELRNFRLNISPKLQEDCHDGLTFDDILDLYHQVHVKLLKSDIPYTYKFVHSQESESRILRFTQNIENYDYQLYMMPLTPDRSKFNREEEFLSEFRINCQKTVEFCVQHNFRFSPREHIWIFGDLKNEYGDLRKIY